MRYIVINMDRKYIRSYVMISILDILRDNKMHGYGLMKRIENITGFKPPPSIIYPVLKLLEKKGFVRSEHINVKNKRLVFFSITDNGLKFLEENRELVEKARLYNARLRRFREMGFPELLDLVKEIFNKAETLSQVQMEKIRRSIEEFKKTVSDLLEQLKQ
ncbi:MAG: PadR family transcriptional regulator [Desulfurococcaceae archaeon]